MNIKIKDIADVFLGVYSKDSIDGEVAYLQVKDIKNNNLVLSSTSKIELNTQTEKHLLSNGNLLFAAKGTSNFCLLYKEENIPAVAASSFLVIKIRDLSIVEPQYVCWYLNRSNIISFLKTKAVGSSIPSIGKSAIEDCQINIPPISIQQKIVEIDKLQKKEAIIYQQIFALKNKLVEKQLIKIIQNS